MAMSPNKTVVAYSQAHSLRSLSKGQNGDLRKGAGREPCIKAKVAALLEPKAIHAVTWMGTATPPRS